MRKKHIFAIAGVGLLFAGCSDSIMGDHRYRTIPVDDIPYDQPVDKPQKETMPASLTPPPIPAVGQQTVARVSPRKYPQMTGAVSSGGVDSVQRKTGSKGIVKNRPAIAADGIHVVRRGETPGFIAKKYKVRLSDLMSVNNLTEESAKKLQIGQKLTIPASTGSKAVVKKQENRTKGSASVSTSGGTAVKDGKYKVQSGDTPERIARRLTVKLTDLLKANNLDENSARRLQIGQMLIIPGAAAENISAAGGTAVVDNAAVKKESPAVNETPVEQPPQEENAVETMEQDLYEVTEDTSFAALAEKYGITEAALRKMNGGMTDETIHKGALIIVPRK